MSCFAKAGPDLVRIVIHGKQIGRNCDIYVFCLNTGRTRETANPMDVSTWEFYVAATSYLDKVLSPTQKSVSLNKIRNLAGAKKVSYDGIKDEIDRLIKSGEAQAHNYIDDGTEFRFEP